MKRLYIVGLGPGGGDTMTPQARQALEESQVLCGYTTYLDLAGDLLEGREVISTPMTRELERCRLALESADSGKTTAMICSGDPGVYGMAGPILELSEHYPQVDIQVIPGVTAALAGAAVLGAPLMHDFVVLSLSDLLTPWPVIEKRLDCAGAGDFVVCLYNPMSKKRRDHLARACRILLNHRSPETPCGWVRNIGREGQEYKLLTLAELEHEEVDMFTTVFIGSSSTRRLGDRLATPRGDEGKKCAFSSSAAPPRAASWPRSSPAGASPPLSAWPPPWGRRSWERCPASRCWWGGGMRKKWPTCSPG